MSNSNDQPPPQPPPQVADRGVDLDDPSEKPLQGFQYATLPSLTPPPQIVTLQATRYYEYSVAKVIEDRSGLMVTPIMGPPGTPASVTRECAPYGWMSVAFRASRHGSTPQIPSRDLGDPNLVYKGGRIVVTNPGYLADGTEVISIEGQYEYWLRVPYTEGDTILTATNPFLDQPIAENVLKPGDYNKAIAGPNQSPAGAPTNVVTF